MISMYLGSGYSLFTSHKSLNDSDLRSLRHHRLTLLCSFELEDIGENLSDGDVETGRDFRTDVDIAIQHARERRRFEQGNFVFGCNFANPRSDNVCTLRHYDGRTHA